MNELQKSKSGNWVIPNSFQTPNFLADDLMFYLTPEEVCCLVYAIRNILGFQDKIVGRKANISLSSFSKTGLGQQGIRAALEGLGTYNVLIPEGDPTQKGQLYKLQEDADAINWEMLKQRRITRDAKGIARTSKATVASIQSRTKGVTSDVTPDRYYVGRKAGVTSDVDIKTQDQTQLIGETKNVSPVER